MNFNLERLSSGGFNELLTKDAVGALPLVEAVLVFHDLFFQQLDTLLEQSISTALVLIRPLGADMGGAGAADLMWADLKEGEITQA